MIIHLLSDTHLEFGPLEDPFSERAAQADLRLLAGDIGVGSQGLAWALRRFDTPTAYVFGNHEHYGNRPMPMAAEQARALCSGTHVSPLERNELIVVPGARVLGATLWTGFDLFGNPKRDRESMEHAALRMSDYRQVCLGYRHGHDAAGRPLPIPQAALLEGETEHSNRVGLTPEETVRIHRETLAWLDAKLSEPFEGKTIVLSHHAPHPKSLTYGEPGSLMDGAYASDLSLLMRRHRIDLWAHGHTHIPCDYMVGSTRVVSNPRGYCPDALVEGFDHNFTVEI